MKKISNQLPHSSQQVRVGSLLDEDTLVKKQALKRKLILNKKVTGLKFSLCPPQSKTSFQILTNILLMSFIVY
jgi:hypothetical protein